MLDNGSEFTSNLFDAWAYMHDVQIDFIQPGKPVQNCHIESFNGSVRDELLNTSWFESLDDARRSMQAWRADYNGDRPHSSLGDLSPSQFASGHDAGPKNGAGSRFANRIPRVGSI